MHCKIVDKREVQLKSPTMERLGLKRALTYFKTSSVSVHEMVTDASIVIISMMGMFINELVKL